MFVLRHEVMVSPHSVHLVLRSSSELVIIQIVTYRLLTNVMSKVLNDLPVAFMRDSDFQHIRQEINYVIIINISISQLFIFLLNISWFS